MLSYSIGSCSRRSRPLSHPASRPRTGAVSLLCRRRGGRGCSRAGRRLRAASRPATGRRGASAPSPAGRGTGDHGRRASFSNAQKKALSSCFQSAEANPVGPDLGSRPPFRQAHFHRHREDLGLARQSETGREGGVPGRGCVRVAVARGSPRSGGGGAGSPSSFSSMDRSISASPSFSSKKPALAAALGKQRDLAGEPRHRRLLDQCRYLAPALPVAFVLALARGLAIDFEPAPQAFGQGVPVPAQPFPEIGAGVFEDRAGAFPVLRVAGFERAAQGSGRGRARAACRARRPAPAAPACAPSDGRSRAARSRPAPRH